MNDAESGVNIKISTNVVIKVRDCSKDISTLGSNSRTHQLPCFGNTRQKGCFVLHWDREIDRSGS